MLRKSHTFKSELGETLVKYSIKIEHLFKGCCLVRRLIIQLCALPSPVCVRSVCFKARSRCGVLGKQCTVVHTVSVCFGVLF